jgi:hypothetical protein
MPHQQYVQSVANLAPFGSRPIVGAVEVLMTKFVHRQLSVLLIVPFFIATAVSVE